DTVAYEDGFESIDAMQFADAPVAPPAPAAQPLTTTAKREIIEAVAQIVSPDGFATIVTDDEHAKHLSDHPARRPYHHRLSFGIGRWNQAKDLGQLPKLMRSRDEQKFREVFGPNADALIEVTNRPGPSAAHAPDGRGPRVQPVGGEDLWSPGWVKRFRDAAR